MAFSNFGNPSMGTQAAGGAQSGPDLETIQTEGLGFLALAGDAKVQLLPTAWPTEQLPPPTSSLMSIASRKGLIAAAGPDAVIIAKTKSVRQAFEGSETGDNNIKPFRPELTLPMPMRVSQLAFTADESYLILSAENGGGLAVYDVDAILNGATNSAFEVSTNGVSLRALSPNPEPKTGELLAVVTNNGNLMMANLKERNFASGPNGQVLKDGVSCVSWSTKGKQLVAGLGNGTTCQMTPEGEVKAEIPRPPDVDAGDHVSSITWLENHIFLVVHTPTQFDNSMAPQGSFRLVTRQPPSSYVFQKIDDPAGPFGVNRSPPHHFLLRLKDFPPNLQDVLFVTSSAALDIGLFSRSKTPLTSSKPADKITGQFTLTEFADDSRRAQVPIGNGMSDTSPIGLALDLSGDEKVLKPIPGDEINESSTPLPALMVLNHEGALAAWWFIYSESIRQGTAYPGLIAAGGATQATQPAVVPTQTPSAFGNVPSALKPAPGSLFGQQSTASPAFGGPSSLGQKSSPWGGPATSASQSGSTISNTPVFGGASTLGGGATFSKPSFGATSTPAFGGTSMPGRQSVWGSSTSAAQPTLGQTGRAANPAAPFGSALNTGGSAPSTGGFSSFAGGSGFAGAAASQTGGSVFSKPASSPFGGPSGSSIFGVSSQADSKPATSLFGAASQTDNKAGSGLFGGSSQPDKTSFGSFSGMSFGTTFKADPSNKDDGGRDSNESSSKEKSSFFGGDFGSALGAASKEPAAEGLESKDAEMDSDEPARSEESVNNSSTTPTATPAPNRFQSSSTTPGTTLFGTTPAQPPASAAKPTGFSFGQPPAGDKPPTLSFSNLTESPGLTPKTPIDPEPKPSVSTTPATPQIKTEPESNESGGISNEIPEAPLPPESTSSIPRSTPGAGPSSPAPAAEASKKPPIPQDLIPPMDVPGGSEDDGGSSDFLTEEDEDENSQAESDEGSGEDVAKDLSPSSASNQTPGFTPQSSFNTLQKQSSSGLFFQKVGESNPPPRKLFGEGSAAPTLPPPKPVFPISPRSPSPVRGGAVPPRLRPDASRSVSAPGHASQLLGQRPGGRPPSRSSESTFALALEQKRAEEQRREEARARKEAEETRALVDEEDDEMQNYLAEPPEPTRTLNEFIAYTDHESLASVDSIPAQVEAVYRDINSMIDTLGQNAKHLKGFIQAHTEQNKDTGRTKKDLENEDDWVLVEIEALSNIVEIDLGRELQQSRIQDVAEKLEACNELQKDLIRLRAKHEDIRRIIDAQRDPEQLAQARAQPLNAEQLAQQKDVRQGYKKFQQLLSEAEEALTFLKTKVVSAATSNGAGSSGPTVEAVMRTITKMTSMAEKRSGDIDVLEGQMRKLRLGSLERAGSRESTPFSTPQTNRQSLRNPGTSSTYGLFYTPESTRDTPRNMRESTFSNGSFGMSSPAPRKKLSGYTPEEKAQLKSKLARRKEVVEKLRGALQRAGPNVRLMDGDQ